MPAGNLAHTAASFLPTFRETVRSTKSSFTEPDHRFKHVQGFSVPRFYDDAKNIACDAGICIMFAIFFEKILMHYDLI